MIVLMTRSSSPLLKSDFKSRRLEHRHLELLDVLNFDLVGVRELRDEHCFTLLLQGSELFRMRLFSVFPFRLITIYSEKAIGLSNQPFSSQRKAVNQNSSIVASTCCSMNPATGSMSNAVDNIRFMTAFINVSDCNHRLEHYDRTSSSAPQLNSLITIVSASREEAVLVLFDANLLPSSNMSVETRLVFTWSFTCDFSA